MPSNFGAYAGKFIDGFNGVSINEVGKYQMGMGFANDLTMFDTVLKKCVKSKFCNFRLQKKRTIGYNYCSD